MEDKRLNRELLQKAGRAHRNWELAASIGETVAFQRYFEDRTNGTQVFSIRKSQKWFNVWNLYNLNNTQMGSMMGGSPEGWESSFCLRQIQSANLKSRNAEQATRKNNLEIGEQVQVSYANSRVIGIQMT